MRTVTLTDRADNPATFEFEAGQYLVVMHPNGTLIPLSIASAPNKLPLVELLYRSDLSSDIALAFDDLLGTSTSLTIDGPLGDVTLARLNPTGGLRIVASGTGVAQALSLVGALSDAGTTIPIEVLWATQIQTPSSNRLLVSHPGLAVTRCNSKALPAKLLESVERSMSSSGETKTVIAGPPDFVYQVTDALLAAGVSQDSLAADAFAYAPRP